MCYNHKTIGAFSAWAVRLLPIAVILACATAWGAAQSDTVAPVPDAPMGSVTVDPNQVRVEGGLIKFIAFEKGSDIQVGLRLLAKYWKKNIVPSAGVTGPLNCPELRDVTFEQALAAMLGDNFVAEQDGNLIYIRTKEEHRKIKEDPERMVHKVITLYYITAAEASKLIQPVLSDTAKIQATTAAQTGVSAGEGSVSGGGGGDNIASNDMIVVFDFPEKIEKAEQVIREIDERPKQVLIEAAIMSATLSEDTHFGIDWNLLSGVAVTKYPVNIVAGQGALMETTGFAQPSLSGLRVGFSADNVQAIITALEEVTDTTLLANPKILAVNKQEGTVYIGTRLGYVDTTTQNQSGSTTESVTFLDTGTRLAFRPYIGNDGFIRMDIYPKDSDGVLQQNGIPLERSTELRTNVIVKDGETIVIGGLFRDSVTTSKSQVPILGNLPVLGGLFRGSIDGVERQEVIVILTPHIIEEPSQAGGADRAEDIRRKMDGAKGAMQWFGRARLAEDAYARAARFYLEGDVDSAMFHVKVALQMRPTYLEARRLHERIIAETDPEELKRIESIVEQAIDQQEANNWQRY